MRLATYRKSATTLGLMCVLALAGCNIETGSGVAVSEDRKVDDFDSVTVSGSSTVTITVGPEKSVKVTCDDNLIEMIKTDVSGGTLHVHSKGSYSTSIGIKVEVTVPKLKEVQASGSSNIEATNVSGPEFAIGVSGAGDVVASGQVDKLNVTVSGSGDATLKGLKAKKANVSVSGAGDAYVHATESINAVASGSGDIEIYGNPADVKKKATGAADIEIMQ